MPAAVPSVRQSFPCRSKKPRRPTRCKNTGGRPTGQGSAVPGIVKVPAAVPSLIHTESVPAAQARNTTLAPSGARSWGDELAARGEPIRARRWVPAAVRSLTNGWRPVAGSRAVKTIRPSASVRSSGGARKKSGGRMPVSARRTVPAAVPSEAQRTPCRSVKTTPPRAGLICTGPPSQVPGQRSLTCRVPAAVPSVTHSSRPCTASRPGKKRRPFTSTAGVRPVSGAGQPPGAGQPVRESGRFIPGESVHSPTASLR